MIDMVDKSLGRARRIPVRRGVPERRRGFDADGQDYELLLSLTQDHPLPDSARQGQSLFLDVLSWMCHATEYDELPVRHNEDLINAELSRNLTFPGTSFGLPMWDPHVKSFLLLQAHMSRISLPITDYVGDQTSVLDQAIRIIQASIDVLTELGHLSRHAGVRKTAAVHQVCTLADRTAPLHSPLASMRRRKTRQASQSWADSTAPRRCKNSQGSLVSQLRWLADSAKRPRRFPTSRCPWRMSE